MKLTTTLRLTTALAMGLTLTACGGTGGGRVTSGSSPTATTGAAAGGTSVGANPSLERCAAPLGTLAVDDGRDKEWWGSFGAASRSPAEHLALSDQYLVELPEGRSQGFHSGLAPGARTPDITALRGRCGRSSRQPGQIRKEAAVTNSLRVMPVSHPFPCARRRGGRAARAR